MKIITKKIQVVEYKQPEFFWWLNDFRKEKSKKFYLSTIKPKRCGQVDFFVFKFKKFIQKIYLQTLCF